MDIKKRINIIISDLTTDLLVSQEEIESLINEPTGIAGRVAEIKSALKNLVLAELMINKFNALINDNQDPNS